MTENSGTHAPEHYKSRSTAVRAGLADRYDAMGGSDRTARPRVFRPRLCSPLCPVAVVLPLAAAPGESLARRWAIRDSWALRFSDFTLLSPGERALGWRMRLVSGFHLLSSF